MSDQQSTLGTQQNIADELAAQQQQASIAEFFSKNKQMLGFDSPGKSLITTVKEAVDNALDAAEEVGINPDIFVEIERGDDYYHVTVEDNGPGITKQEIPKVFGRLLYGSRFHSREQARGQQGIGISAAVLYSQLTSGHHTKITSKPKSQDQAHYYELIIDEEENRPDIRTEKTIDWDKDHGTRIELTLEADMRARDKLHRYIEYTAVVNPHATIEFHEPSTSITYERATDELPPETSEIPPHPHGVDLGTVQKMLEATKSQTLSGFLQEEFTRVGRKSAENILNNFRDRHYGREPVWYPPDDAEYEQTVRNTVANKKAEEVDEFASYIADAVTDAEALAYSDVAALVHDAADEVEDGFATRFGSTVREKTTAAIWGQIQTGRDQTLHEWLDDETTTRKDGFAVQALAMNLAGKFGGKDTQAETAARITYADLEEMVNRSADTTEENTDERFGDTARENIITRVWGEMKTVDDDVPLVRQMTRDTTECLLRAMRETNIIAPPTDCLSPIGEDKLETGLRTVFEDAEFYTTNTRDADVHGGDPFIAEAGIAYGPDIFDTDEHDDSAELLRFANRVPLVYQRGACATSDVVKRINWQNYFKGRSTLNQSGGRGMPSGPLVILVHVASTNVPFTSESKDAIANVNAIEDEIELALRGCARELKSHLKEQRDREQRREKRNVLGTILPDMGKKLAQMTGNPEPEIAASVSRIMNNIYIEREATTEAVTISVTNHEGRGTSTFTVVDRVDAEPEDLNGDADVIEDGDEWVVEWETTVESGDATELTYTVDETETVDITVDDIAPERVTIATADENTDRGD